RRADLLVKKPPPLSFVDAAALPQAGQMALQALRSFAPVQPGQKVLINGAGGGVGTFAVQMARAWGAEVTGVDHGSKLDMLRSLGAAHVLDYTSCDYTRQGQQYDLIVDCNVRGSALKYRRALAPGGTFVAVGGVIPWLLEHLLWGLALKALGAGKKMRILPYVSKSADMEQLAELLQAGQVKPVIERTLPLEGVPEALGLLEKGLVRGKLVIAMD
ncbi:MAG: NAD(P)-dependent alcohol dehydrogenase, partial [Deltaproteobacteria bacterium]|nr:NAD(P)-dependent alcohol dehydrogenase [Deltaproteobacteria bacterium]